MICIISSGCQNASVKEEENIDVKKDAEEIEEIKVLKKQRKLSPSIWDGVTKETVKSLPTGINGLKVYRLENSKALKDGRRWKKNAPTDWKGHERVRFSDCRGSYKCAMNKCPYKIQYGVTNTMQFEKKDGIMVCKGCGEKGIYVSCDARRYLSFRGESVTVYHIGTHSCPVYQESTKIEAKLIEEIVQNQPDIKPSEIQSTFILNAFQKRMEWDEVQKVV